MDQNLLANSTDTQHCMWDCLTCSLAAGRSVPYVACDQSRMFHLQLQLPAYTSLHAQQRLSGVGYMPRWLPMHRLCQIGLLMREGLRQKGPSP